MKVDGWQTRALRESDRRAFRVFCAVLAVEMPDKLPIMLRIAYPAFIDLELPVLVGYAKIGPDGGIYCRVHHKDRTIDVRSIYDDEDELRYEFRTLADKLKLDDADRYEMFGLIQKWIAADLRINHEGKKVA